MLDFPYVDVHDGWLIFQMPPAELGLHPANAPSDVPQAADSGRSELYLMCDDINATVSELTAKGVEFIGPVQQQGFGALVHLRVPGAGEIGLYQPRHPTAHDLGV